MKFRVSLKSELSNAQSMYMIERKVDYDAYKRKGNPRFKSTTTVFINLSTIVATDVPVDKLDSEIKFTYFL